MLSKLLKHEFKATSRLLMPIYMVLVVLTIMDRLVLSLDKFDGALTIIPVFITFAYIISLVAIVVVSFVIIILRFYKNLMTDEGYLMFTLPAKPSQLINSKLLVSIVWTVASVIAVILSLLGVFATPDRMNMLADGLRMAKIELVSEFGTTNMALLTIEMILLIVLGTINSILTIYASVAVGQLFNGHKVLGSFAAYIGISTVLQIIVTLGMVLLGFIFDRSFEDINALPQIVFPLTLLYTVVTNVIFYWLTNLLFKRKLNLD